jgi:hypothetical protein
VAVVCALVAPAHAQIGPRAGGPAPADIDGTTAAVELALAGNLARGLVDRDLVSARGSLALWHGPWGLWLQPYYLYGDVKLADKLPRTQTDDERYLRVNAFRALSRPLFAWIAGVFDHSLRRRIGHRSYVGGGTGATLVDRADVSFVASLGVLGEDTHFDSNVLPDMTVVPASVRDVARMSLRMYGRYRLASNHITLTHDLFVMPDVQDTSDVRVLLSGIVEVPIVAGLAARAQIDASYEQYIVPGTKHDDVAITFGASYHGAVNK